VKTTVTRLLFAGAIAANLAVGATNALAQTAALTTPAPASDVNETFIGRFFKAYTDDWAGVTAPVDPNAPPTRRAEPFPPQPQTQPPFPFIDWPYGGASTIGASVPNAVISPLMSALAPTGLGKAMSDAHIQMYGWVNPGFNLSNNTRTPGGKGGNFPAAYSYWANTAQLDQFALYLERVPDTVQKDHIDWGFRVTGIYGMNYRYTTAQGLWSYQLLKRNNQNGYDFPMVYGELYVPQIAQGLLIRVGRFVSVPDIEAQLAPNNYMYSHSMTYAYDNYTNTGIMNTLQLTKNWLAQFGVTVGTDVVHWNPPPGVGQQPSYTGCLRWSSDSSYDNVYGCMNAINRGNWGYNNLQQKTITYYHKFNEKWHIAFEYWYMSQKNVPNVNVTGGDYTGTPWNGFRNPPNQAHCNTGTQCTANEQSFLTYLNYRINDHNNLSFRAEYFDDKNGQRTGYKTQYANVAVGIQHWLGSTVTFRPEVALYNSLDKRAFDSGTRRTAIIASADVVWHF
jgi:hypothetical protein